MRLMGSRTKRKMDPSPELFSWYNICHAGCLHDATASKTKRLQLVKFDMTNITNVISCDPFVTSFLYFHFVYLILQSCYWVILQKSDVYINAPTPPPSGAQFVIQHHKIISCDCFTVKVTQIKFAWYKHDL